MINRYSDFVENSMINGINESIVYLSPPLRKILTKIHVKGDVVASALRNIEGDDIKKDITFLDVGEEGFISFTTMKKAMPMISKIYGTQSGNRYPRSERFTTIDTDYSRSMANILYDDDMESSRDATLIYKKSRTPVKIGRLINNIFPKMFTDKQIEDFVNKFKATIENIGEKIKIVEGEDIAFWYKEENYWDQESGTLGKSCMKDMGEKTFKIYSENPEVCRMLIITEDNKLKARALIWKTKNDIMSDDGTFEYFLDRQYTYTDSLVHKLREYADDQGWAYKTNNVHDSFHRITFKGKDIDADISVKVKSEDYDDYPYMDTFRRYEFTSGTLFNDDDQSNHGGQYLLDSASGGRSVINEYGEDEDQEGRVYSEREGEWIDDYDAVFCEDGVGWINVNDAAEVIRGTRSNLGWYPTDSNNIVYSDRDGEYFHIEDTVYSETYGGYILSDDSICIITELRSDGGVSGDGDYIDDDDTSNYVSTVDLENFVWYDALCASKKNWKDFSGISTDLLTKDYNDDWILKDFKILTYKVINPEDLNGVEYLLSIDAELLHKNIDLKDSRKTDWWTYTAYLQEAKLLTRILRSAKAMGGQLKFDFMDDELERVKVNKISKRISEIESDSYLA